MARYTEDSMLICHQVATALFIVSEQEIKNTAVNSGASLVKQLSMTTCITAFTQAFVMQLW